MWTRGGVGGEAVSCRVKAGVALVRHCCCICLARYYDRLTIALCPLAVPVGLRLILLLCTMTQFRCS